MNDNKMAPGQAEYSLPGVMKYLQSEWQRNERDRIQWELERAEMRSKIAKLEGEKHSLQLLADNYAKQLRLLESTVMNGHHDNADKATTGISNNNTSELYSQLRKQFDELSQKTTASENPSADTDLSPLIDARKYLDKCIKDISYLLQSVSVLDPGEASPNLSSGDTGDAGDTSNGNGELVRSAGGGNSSGAERVESTTNAISSNDTTSHGGSDSVPQGATEDTSAEFAKNTRRLGELKLSTVLKFSDQVTCVVACSQDTVAVGLQTGLIKYQSHEHYTLGQGASALVLSGHSGAITAICWNAKAKTLYSGDKTGLICVHSLVDADPVSSGAGATAATTVTSIEPVESYRPGISGCSIVQLEFDESSQSLVCVTSDDTVMLSSATDLQTPFFRRYKLREFAKSNVIVSFRSTQLLYIAYTADNCVECIDIKQKTVVNAFNLEFVRNSSYISSFKAASFRSTDLLYIGMSNGSLMSVNATTGDLISKLTRHLGPVAFIEASCYESCYSDGGKEEIVLSGGADDKVLLWRPDLKLIQTPSFVFSDSHGVKAACWNTASPNPSFIIVCGDDSVRCFGTTTDKVKYLES